VGVGVRSAATRYAQGPVCALCSIHLVLSTKPKTRRETGKRGEAIWHCRLALALSPRSNANGGPRPTRTEDGSGSGRRSEAQCPGPQAV
jgi:hypothetical protein